jgi:hypothetical protein
LGNKDAKAGAMQKGDVRLILVDSDEKERKGKRKKEKEKNKVLVNMIQKWKTRPG